jgi:hypothetical protein
MIDMTSFNLFEPTVPTELLLHVATNISKSGLDTNETISVRFTSMHSDYSGPPLSDEALVGGVGMAWEAIEGAVQALLRSLQQTRSTAGSQNNGPTTGGRM